MPVDQHSDPFEDRLAAALRDTGAGFDADQNALTAAGRTRGRRLRLRRRAAVAGGVAGIAMVGVGGVFLLPGDDAAGPQRSSTASAPTASPAQAPKSFSGDDLVRTLKGLLPEGRFSQETARGSKERLGPAVRLVYDDGQGAAAIAVGLGRVEPGSEQARETTTCPDEVFVPHDACTTSRLPDGSVLMLFQGYEYPDRRVDTKWWNAELVTPQGQHVSVSEWNAPAQKDAEISRETPPLTPEQLKGIATAGVWRQVVDAIPKRPKDGPVPGVPRQVSGQAVGETLAGLLPDGVKVVSRGGQESEYAYLVVDDGKGASMVQVNVQHGMADAADQLYGSAETLPDGTRVTTRQGTGDDRVPGVVMWTADTLRPGTDGFRVVIGAFNNASAHGEPTRDTPALTLEQLREIALSPEWDKLR
ncbi:hypothetical protein [Streptomyces sp. NPDC006134]|uniref:hypothetical protein n=1 Tax=Streptomyces sp. NPDC006134 TaxID=3154467 RepID=UPI0034019C3C